MEQELWYRWRELSREAAQRPIPMIDHPASDAQPIKLRWHIGLGLIRLGRAIASTDSALAVG